MCPSCCHIAHCNTPHVGVVALFPEAGADGRTLLLHDGALVGNRLCGSHIPNELLDWRSLACMHSWGRELGVREAIVPVAGTPPQELRGRGGGRVDAGGRRTGGAWMEAAGCGAGGGAACWLLFEVYRVR